MNIFKHDELIDDNNDTVLTYVGVYYDIKKNSDEMIKYHKLEIELGNSAAMNNLGQYYETINGYDNMIKYYIN